MLLTHSREESGKFGYTADANTTISTTNVTTNTVTIVVLTCMSVGADKKVGRSLAGDEAEEEDSEYTGSELFFELPSGRWRYLKDNECFVLNVHDGWFFYQIRWQWSVTPTKDLVQEKRLKGRQKLISNWRIQWSWKGDFWLWKQTRQWFWKMRPARKSLPGQTIPGINDAHTDRDELKTPTGLPCF